MNTTTTIAAAIVTDARRVLLVRRRYPEAGLVWQFPAGKVEAGETVVEAAVRETVEEAGLVVRAVRVLGARRHPVTGRDIAYVACEPVSGQAHLAAPDEVAEVCWCPTTKLDAFIPDGVFEPVRDYLAARPPGGDSERTA